MNKTFLTLTALVALVAPYALAHECVEPFYGRDSEELRISDPETGQVIWYIDNDFCQTEGCIFSFWIYEETNNYPNLQRQDATDHEDFDKYTQDDTCHGMIPADKIVL